MREAISVLLMALPVIGLYLVIRNGVRSFRQPKRIVSDAQGKKKISTNPWFFDCFSRKVYFYDDRYFYEIQKDRTTQVELARIVNIQRRSSLTINASTLRTRYPPARDKSRRCTSSALIRPSASWQRRRTPDPAGQYAEDHYRKWHKDTATGGRGYC